MEFSPLGVEFLPRTIVQVVTSVKANISFQEEESPSANEHILMTFG